MDSRVPEKVRGMALVSVVFSAALEETPEGAKARLGECLEQKREVVKTIDVELERRIRNI